MPLTFAQLQSLVASQGVAVRVHQRLQPAGGSGDKVFPPTYATGDDRLKYVFETRRVDGQDVPCVLLDSVASQANRMEEALLAAWEQRALAFPVIGVDFSADAELADIGAVTSLQAPHRLADAILRDATDESGKTLFRNLPEGKAFTEASLKNASVVFALCPTALIFGVWDSTGPKGGLGAKFQRALTSEIVGIHAVYGSKVGSRIDPIGIQAVDVFQSKDSPEDWTADPSQAKKDAKGNPIPYGAKGKSKASAVNHSNIAPTIDGFAGGVTFDYALQTVVLSLPALRRLRFATDLEGKALSNRADVEQAARVALGALALAAIVHQRAHGYDLRSRCLLVPDGPLSLEIIDGEGATSAASLSVEQANALVQQAGEAALAAGLGWKREPLRLRPAPKLVALIKRSRAEAAAGAADEAGA